VSLRNIILSLLYWYSYLALLYVVAVQASILARFAFKG